MNITINRIAKNLPEKKITLTTKELRILLKVVDYAAYLDNGTDQSLSGASALSTKIHKLLVV
jgi:hypothetical protein